MRERFDLIGLQGVVDDPLYHVIGICITSPLLKFKADAVSFLSVWKWPKERPWFCIVWGIHETPFFSEYAIATNGLAMLALLPIDGEHTFRESPLASLCVGNRGYVQGLAPVKFYPYKSRRYSTFSGFKSL
ncbi:hypothetical protein [Sinorhizobium meliloti]|uniref:hypothetical protein n=1 Tax=Rhizobium meliloti TaxID=382 RepID=UPI001F19E4D5|nr:hypothetical protein [Sinorhizobium meliloti]